MSDVLDYQRVAKAIAFIRERALAQPSLQEIAAHLDLSETYVQRLFLRWAGISPKQFMQYLSREHAKALLAQQSVETTALDLGYGSASRLHDLWLKFEGMTPGDYKRSAQGLLIEYGCGITPFGMAFIAQTSRGICQLAFYDDALTLQLIKQEFQAQWGLAQHHRDDMMAAELLEQIFSPMQMDTPKPLSVLMKGSEFQLHVWQALIKVPFAQVCSYGQLSEKAGKPAAVRAAASAVANNPIAWLIPCHRVIRANGDYNQYRWGADRKRAMIVYESAKFKGDGGI